MNKLQLIHKVSISSSISKVMVNRALNVITSLVIESLKHGDSVSFTGFGTFMIKIRASRIIKNPKTGERIFVESYKVPSFRAGKKLKSSVN